MSSQLLSTPATHPFSIASLADRAWNAATQSVFKVCLLRSVLSRIAHGQIRIDTETRSYVFPEEILPTNKFPHVRAHIHVLRPSFWLRLALMSDLGFSEAYMFGDIDCEDLIAVFEIFLRNRSELSSLDSGLSSIFATISQRLASSRFLNSISNTRGNISAHYDISNDMFMGFLSKDMTYSCAIFPDLDSDLTATSSSISSSSSSSPQSRVSSPSPAPHSRTSSHSSHTQKLNTENDVLFNAQMRKLEHLIKKCDIRPGHKVLEIGSGWGAMAILITSTIPGTTVETLTLSSQQQSLVRERVKNAGLVDEDGVERVRCHLMDYRDMPEEWEGTFDRVISVEMVEAVGKEFLETYWAKIDWALKKDTGVGVVQGITIPESRYETYIREVDFIRKWIFPGGNLPTLTHLISSLTSGTGGRLVVDSVCNIGPHYSRTLREWRRRFEGEFENTIIPALKREYPDLMGGVNGEEEIEVFRRKWIYYYCYCEIGFTNRILGDHIITFAREGYQDFGCNVYA
ncbi:CFS1-like protein [Abortiporus biennis]|nr:CFS1-like protein [Abortiporus biennis]